MNYNKIYNPKTNKFVNIDSKTGKYVLNLYMKHLNGGANNKTRRNRGCGGRGRSEIADPAAEPPRSSPMRTSPAPLPAHHPCAPPGALRARSTQLPPALRAISPHEGGEGSGAIDASARPIVIPL